MNTYTGCGRFTATKRPSFQQRQMLIKAITLSARWLDKSGAVSSRGRLPKAPKILSSPAFGNTAISPPFATSSHGEEYLDLGKGLQVKQRQPMNQIVQGLTVIDELVPGVSVQIHSSFPCSQRLTHVRGAAFSASSPAIARQPRPFPHQLPQRHLA